MTGLSRALSDQRFALLWSGQALSSIGDEVFYLALAWWVVERTGSPGAMATLLLVGFAAMVPCGLLGGVLADRLSRVRIMLACDLGRGALLAGATALTWYGRLEYWHVIVIAVVFGAVDAFFAPAYFATIPRLIRSADLPSANALSALSGRLARAVGPLLGGALLALDGTTTLAFATNAASFFISALALVWMGRLSGPGAQAASAPEPEEAAPPPGAVHQGVAEGFAAVLRLPWLWMSILFWAIANAVVSGFARVALPFVVERDWGRGAETLGYYYAMIAVGNMAAAVVAGRWTRLRRRGLRLYQGASLVGVSYALLAAPLQLHLDLRLAGLPVALLLSLFVAFAAGFGVSLSNQIWFNMMQELVPRRLYGRVSSLDQIGSIILVPVGAWAAGQTVGAIGSTLLFAICGGAIALLAAVGLALRSIRDVD